MIVIASCGHNCDDERIYDKQIPTLLSGRYEITYYTYCYNSYLTNEYNDKIQYRFFNSSEISQKQYKKLLFNTLNNKPPKIFHIHDMELLSVAYKLKANHKHMKIIYDVHEDLDAMWDTFSSYSGVIKKTINFMLAKYEKQYLSCIDYFILANRLANQKKYQSYAKIEVIENFPLLQHMNECVHIDNPYKLIYHGQLSEERGLIHLINAFQLLRKTNEKLELTLIGSCRSKIFETKFNNLIKDNKNINYIGQVEHSKIWSYLKDAHIGVIPFKDVALCQYNTPTKLFEYMIANCGVVASNLLPIKEFCSKSASWANPNDTENLVHAINYYLNNINIYNEHRNINNRLIKNSYNWENISDNILNIYKELLS